MGRSWKPQVATVYVHTKTVNKILPVFPLSSPVLSTHTHSNILIFFFGFHLFCHDNLVFRSGGVMIHPKYRILSSG